mgnify:CR=1 FL=1
MRDMMTVDAFAATLGFRIGYGAGCYSISNQGGMIVAYLERSEIWGWLEDQKQAADDEAKRAAYYACAVQFDLFGG